MLFHEFQENTGCHDNEYNHTLFKRLEIIYMNDDTISKSEIYEMGKKLMNNDKSEKQLAFEKGLKDEMNGYKEQIKVLKNDIKYYKTLLVDEWDKTLIKEWKSSIRWRREDIKRLEQKIYGIKWVLGII